MLKKIFALFILMNFLSMIFAAGSGNQIIRKISPQEAYAMMHDSKYLDKLVIIDVRTGDEFEDGHVEKALNMDILLNDFLEKIGRLDRSKIYLVYCRTGHRAGNAVEKMKELGFMEVYNFGGIIDWEEAGYKLVR